MLGFLSLSLVVRSLASLWLLCRTGFVVASAACVESDRLKEVDRCMELLLCTPALAGPSAARAESERLKEADLLKEADRCTELDLVNSPSGGLALAVLLDASLTVRWRDCLPLLASVLSSPSAFGAGAKAPDRWKEVDLLKEFGRETDFLPLAVRSASPPSIC